MSLWRWAEWLATVSPEAHITLGEGNTPVVRSKQIGPTAGLDNLYFKLETGNPTGSYKDRFAALAISDMLATGKTRCIATSSGNTGSALAAYCAAANIPCEIILVEQPPNDKVKQMLVYGANLYRVRGFGLDPQITTQTVELVRQMASAPDTAMQISAFMLSPIGMTGVQTISYELVEQLPSIDHVFVPAGGGGLTLAVARGFVVMQNSGSLTSGPAIECVQPEGNNTIAGPLRDGSDEATDVQCTTKISGLQVSTVLDGHDVIQACRTSGGTGHVVTDDEVWSMHNRLAVEEGLFCEPAGAVALAGAIQCAELGAISRDAVVVCLVTGSGFKDSASLDRLNKDRTCPMVELSQVRQRVVSS